MTDRGLSVAVNYVLGLGVATLLITGLLIAAGGLVEDRRESAVRSELRVVGERIAASLATADRLAQAGGETVVVGAPAPGLVAGQDYSIALNATSAEIVLETTDPDVTVRVPFGNETAVSTSKAGGGDVEIVLTSADELEVRPA